MKHDITKLPQWAQQRIGNAERQRDDAHERERRTVKGYTEVWTYGNFGEDDNPLPPKTAVLFNLENGNVRVNVKDGKLQVMALSGSLSVFPQSSNVVNIDSVNRF